MKHYTNNNDTHGVSFISHVD